jgi:hypothetical protein
MRKKVAVLQTCDPFKYAKLLDETSSYNKLWCRKQKYDYFEYRGIWENRLNKPQEAMFNRIFWLQDFIGGRYDYIFYLDADAVVVDPTKDLETDVMGSLSDHSVAYCGNNNGVIGFNMRHKDTIQIIRSWEELYWKLTTGEKELKTIPDEQGNEWLTPNDQQLFFRAIEINKVNSVKKFQDQDPNSPLWAKKFNFNGPFVHQYMRGTSPLISDKVKKHLQAAKTNWKGNKRGQN